MEALHKREKRDGFDSGMVCVGFWWEYVVEKDIVLSIESRDWLLDCEKGIVVVVDDVIVSMCEGIVVVV